MRRLIWAFAVCVCPKTCFHMVGSIWCSIWMATLENVPLDTCTRWRFRSACAFAQSDQNLHWVHFDLPRMQSIIMRTTKTDQNILIRRLILVSVESKKNSAAPQMSILRTRYTWFTDFPPFLIREITFETSSLLFWPPSPFWKGVYSLRKEFALRGVYSKRKEFAPRSPFWKVVYSKRKEFAPYGSKFSPFWSRPTGSKFFPFWRRPLWEQILSF